MRPIPKPKPEEYPAYSHIYMDLLEDDSNILEHLRQNLAKLKEFIYSLPEEKLLYRYAENKWTIKEILIHNIDDERIFAYRALRYGRNDTTPLHGFEQDDYAYYSKVIERSLDSIFEEYESVREATITLFENMPDEAFDRGGSGISLNGEVMNRRTVRALAYHIAGHELHHLNVIKERYV